MKNHLIALFLLIPVSALPCDTWAAFRVYLKSGRVISEVEEISRVSGRAIIKKYGITLEMNEDSIDMVEEYEEIETEGEGREETRTPLDDELPEYLKFNEEEYEAMIQEEEERRREYGIQYQEVLKKLARIEELKAQSKEAESRIYKSLRLLSPRKARFARREKAEIDSQLEELRRDEEGLWKQKKRLERILNIREGYVLEPIVGIDEPYEHEQSEDLQEVEDAYLRSRYPGLLEEGEIGPKIQLRDLKKKEREGTIPEQFAPYKDFLEDQYQRGENRQEGR